MTKLFKIEHNAETGEIKEIELTAQEIAEKQLEAQSQQELETIKATQKAALLERLGITDDEAALLLP
jgi:hypothetical protein